MSDDFQEINGFPDVGIGKVKRMAPALHGVLPRVSEATGTRSHASRPSWAGALQAANNKNNEQPKKLVAWLRENRYVDETDDDKEVLRIAQATFLSAVVLEEGHVKNVPESYTQAVLPYKLYWHGLCAGQRAVARAFNGGVSYKAGVVDDQQREAARTPRSTIGLT